MKKITLMSAISLLIGLSSATVTAAETQRLDAQFGAYPGSAIAPPQGKLSVSFERDILRVEYQLQGLAPSSSGGLHIHSGSSCAVASEVGGHYWDPAIGDDAWNGAKWRSNAQGESRGGVRLVTGYNYSQNIGHAVVIHNSDGARIACGVLKAR
ncbi:MAG: hypothetical protein ACPG4U_13990 [Pseudomonadales bacterium]